MYTGAGLYRTNETLETVSFSVLPWPQRTQHKKVEKLIEVEEVCQDGLQHIRDLFHIPCYKGGIVQFQQSDSVTRLGVIVGPYKNNKILIKLEGDECAQPFNPTCSIRYQATSIKA